MATGLAELIILGLLVDYLFRRMRIPGLVGMMLLGVVMGPCVLGLADSVLLEISGDMRMIALIVILLRAGFELHRDTLRRVGWQALLLSAVPALTETAAIALLGPLLFPLSHLEALILGLVLAAVSPAVVVPLMLDFAARRKGTDKGIPTLVMAAASIDDVFVIVLFTAALGLYTGAQVSLPAKLAEVPVSIVLGTGAGLACGWVLHILFRRFNPRATKRLLVILGLSILLVGLEHRIEAQVPFAALLAVMAIGAVILARSEHMAHELSVKLAKLWVFAEIILFTLVGAQVDVRVAWDAGLAGSLLIAGGLAARSLGTWLCLLGSHLTHRERMFVVVAYLPKATVQAAIGGAPLLAMQAAGMDAAPGQLILAIAVLSILLTAPLGAWAIAVTGERLLRQEEDPGDAASPLGEEELAARMAVEDLMDRDVPSVRKNASLRTVLDCFSAMSYSRCPVTDSKGALAGIIPLDTLRPVLGREHAWPALLAVDVADAPGPVLTPRMSVRDALDRLASTGLEEIPVVDPGTNMLVGLLTHAQAIRGLQEALLCRPSNG